MNSIPQDPPSATKTTTRRRNKWLWIIVLGLLCLLGLESRNYYAHRATLARLQGELIRHNSLLAPLRRDEIDKLLTGSPKKTAISTPELHVDYFSWRGILYDFHLAVNFSPRDEVIDIEDLPLGFGNPTVGEQIPAPAPRAIAEEEINSAIGRAEYIFRNQGIVDEFRENLLSVIDGLPEVKVSTVKGELIWNSFRVPRQNRSLFAFQFTLPSEKPFDLDYAHWVSAWDIAQTGESQRGAYGMSGVLTSLKQNKSQSELFDETRSLDLLRDVQAKGIDLPGKNIVRFGTRSLREFAPQTRFVLWFFLYDNQPSNEFDCKTMLFASEAGQSPARRGAHEICEHIGLRINKSQFAPIPEDLPSALSSLNHHWESGNYGPAAYGRLLRPLLAAFPEVTVSTPRQAQWQKIEFPQGSSTAVRVQVPNSIGGKADLYAAIASDHPVAFRWDRHDQPKGDFRERQVVNVSLPAPLPPPPNQLTVFSCAEGLLETGQEFALWIRRLDAEVQPSVYITMTLIPHPAPDPRSASPWAAMQAAERKRIHADIQPRVSGSLAGVEILPPAAVDGSFVLGVHDRKMAQLMFTPDGRRLVSADLFGDVRIWEVESRRLVGEIDMPEFSSDRLALDSNSQTLAELEAYALSSWNLDTCESAGTLAGATDKEGFLRAITYATQPDEVVLVSSRQVNIGGEIGFEEHGRFVTRGRSANKWSSHPADVNGSIRSLADLPSVNCIAAGITRMTKNVEQDMARSITSVQIWPRDFKKPLQELPLSEDPIALSLENKNPVQIFCHPSGRRIAAISRSGQLKVWDIGTWTELLSQKAATPLLTVSLAPDGETVATTSPDTNAVSLWNISTGKQQFVWQADDVPVTHVTHSSDGKWVATTNTEGVIRLWKSAP